MFDLGMWELLLVGLVALLVLGPEKLPRAARLAGYWVRRARQSWYSVRSEIERELAADEFKRSIGDSRRALGDSVQQVRDSGRRIQRSFTGHLPGHDGDHPAAGDHAQDQPDADTEDPAGKTDAAPDDGKATG